ncbi:MAG: hydrogenase maturation protease [Phycisphaeraceae bacterium]|nr:hydrogenase maturation protease [Phycisphaeraceae bacterium]
MKTLILGYGNTLRGDDGIGVIAAQRLRQAFGDDPHVQVLALHQPTPELADTLSRCDRAIFIDASVDVPEGELRVTALAPGPDAASPSTHHLSPSALLDMAKLLFGSCPHAWLIAVGARDFACRDSLSPPVAAAIEQVLAQVRQLLLTPSPPGRGLG